MTYLSKRKVRTIKVLLGFENDNILRFTSRIRSASHSSSPIHFTNSYLLKKSEIVDKRKILTSDKRNRSQSAVIIHPDSPIRSQDLIRSISTSRSRSGSSPSVFSNSRSVSPAKSPYRSSSPLKKEITKEVQSPKRSTKSPKKTLNAKNKDSNKGGKDNTDKINRVLNIGKNPKKYSILLGNDYLSKDDLLYSDDSDSDDSDDDNSFMNQVNKGKNIEKSNSPNKNVKLIPGDSDYINSRYSDVQLSVKGKKKKFTFGKAPLLSTPPDIPNDEDNEYVTPNNYNRLNNLSINNDDRINNSINSDTNSKKDSINNSSSYDNNLEDSKINNNNINNNQENDNPYYITEDDFNNFKYSINNYYETSNDKDDYINGPNKYYENITNTNYPVNDINVKNNGLNNNYETFDEYKQSNDKDDYINGPNKYYENINPVNDDNVKNNGINNYAFNDNDKDEYINGPNKYYENINNTNNSSKYYDKRNSEPVDNYDKINKNKYINGPNKYYENTNNTYYSSHDNNIKNNESFDNYDKSNSRKNSNNNDYFNRQNDINNTYLNKNYGSINDDKEKIGKKYSFGNDIKVENDFANDKEKSIYEECLSDSIKNKLSKSFKYDDESTRDNNITTSGYISPKHSTRRNIKLSDDEELPIEVAKPKEKTPNKKNKKPKYKRREPPIANIDEPISQKKFGTRKLSYRARSVPKSRQNSFTKDELDTPIELIPDLIVYNYGEEKDYNVHSDEIESIPIDLHDLDDDKNLNNPHLDPSANLTPSKGHSHYVFKFGNTYLKKQVSLHKRK